jgi:hypothetical protein
MSLGRMHEVYYVTPPWVAATLWSRDGNIILSTGLQLTMYLAAADYVLAIVLALHRGRREGQGVKVPAAEASSVL